MKISSFYPFPKENNELIMDNIINTKVIDLENVCLKSHIPNTKYII